MSVRDYLAGLRVHLLPIVVWVVTLLCVIGLFSHRSRRYEIRGIAQGPIHQVAAVSDGRLKTVNVGLFDEVRAGQVVAVVDTTPEGENPRELIKAQTQTVLAEIERLQAEWETTKQQLLSDAAGITTDRVMNQRRLEVDVEDRNFEVMSLEAQIAADEMRLENMALGIKIFIMQGRADANDVGLYELQRLRGEYNALAKQLAENKKLLEHAKADLADAQKRRDAFVQQGLGDPELSAAKALVDKSIEVQRKRLNELQVQLEALRPLELRAPFDGVVSMVLHTAGEAVRAGEPILTIAGKEPTSIVAYTTEEQAGRIRENMVVQLVDRNSQPNLVVDSQVVYVGPTVEQMPPRLWRNPNLPQWGRPILIKVPPNLGLIPGAVVGIRGI